MTIPINQSISNIALVVESYEDAIEFYTQKLNFELIEDTDLGDSKRWVQISPPNSNGTNILLAKASNDQQQQLYQSH
jgi:catechol 2,3-dioxygenase-like lactoylglutathione lyase family enzyme